MMKNEYEQLIKRSIQDARHPVPPRYDLFQSASVMALFIPDDNIKLIFIQKADVKGYPWANQMAFPGGHQEKNDRSPLDTALRELHEELRIRKENVDIIGSLGHFQTINSKNIEAFAGFWNKRDKIVPDSYEISRVFQIPLTHLIDTHKNSGYHIGKPNVMELRYPYEDVVIWGATAKIVCHMLNVIIGRMDYP